MNTLLRTGTSYVSEPSHILMWGEGCGRQIFTSVVNRVAVEKGTTAVIFS